jgi:hypothetical protein
MLPGRAWSCLTYRIRGRDVIVIMLLIALGAAYLFPPWEIYGLARRGRASMHWITARIVSRLVIATEVISDIHARIAVLSGKHVPLKGETAEKARAHRKLSRLVMELSLKDFGVLFQELSLDSNERRKIQRDAFSKLTPEERKLLNEVTMFTQ